MIEMVKLNLFTDHEFTPKTFPPRNTVVVKDRRTVLMCGINPIGSFHFNWTFKAAAVGTTQKPISYIGHSSSNNSDINLPHHFTTVPISETKRENAGTYRCEIQSEGKHAGDERFDAELIVLGNLKLCFNLTLKNGKIGLNSLVGSVTCSSSF